MLRLNKATAGPAEAIRKYAGLIGILALAACSSSGGPRTAGTVATPATASLMKDAVQSALCKGNAHGAVQLLAAEPLVSPTDRFYLALAYELDGHPSIAQPLYAQIMQTGSNGYVKVKCGRTVIADGSLSAEAARRLATVARNLAVMDVNLRPSPSLHEGIPEANPQTNKKGVYNGPALEVKKPDGQTPFGQWFSHLASYTSMDSAVKNKGTLEAKFPALAGIIDQWEIVANGRKAVRLGIRVQEKSDADELCQTVKSHNEYCAVIDTTQ